MAEVRLEHVYKIYPGDVAAVQDANIEVGERDFVVLVGPSGCGKTTTLRMVAGLEEISQGEIYIDDQVVNNVPPKDRDIAMVFQNYALYPHMSVRENMAFGLKLRHFDKAEIERRVGEAAEILELTPLLDRKPKVFLFDEPLSNLDAKLRTQMRAEIMKLHRRLEATILYVTHDQVEAMTMGSKIVVMKDGIVHQVDTPLNLYNKPVNRFVAGFIGSPTMNFVEGEMRGGVFTGGQLSCPLKGRIQQQREGSAMPKDVASTGGSEMPGGKAVMDGPAVLGIRPEDLLWGAGGENEGRLRAEIELDEPMGSEIHLHLRDGETLYVAKVPPDTVFELGTEADMHFDPERVHLFHPETGEALL